MKTNPETFDDGLTRVADELLLLIKKQTKEEYKSNLEYAKNFTTHNQETKPISVNYQIKTSGSSPDKKQTKEGKLKEKIKILEIRLKVLEDYDTSKIKQAKEQSHKDAIDEILKEFNNLYARKKLYLKEQQMPIEDWWGESETFSVNELDKLKNKIAKEMNNENDN